MKILLTGGAGYIGTHISVELLEAGYDLVVIDNLRNSHEEAIVRIKDITGKGLKFYKDDLLDKTSLEKIFIKEKIDAVIHLAGLKAVGESVAIPLEYYSNNIMGSLNLFNTMKHFNVKKIVFSSSAAVYGEAKKVPITEDFPLSAVNPYGGTKLIIENILRDLFVSDDSWSLSILRYFNPVGAHKSGLIGEDPNGIPNNLVPYISQVACGKLKELSIYGNDYPTPDGTCIRDYIHIVDLAHGHIKALEKLVSGRGIFTYNIGTGKGCSVLEMVNAFSEACGKKIPYRFAPRRPGDIATCYADCSKAYKELNFETRKSIKDMCEDAWRWQSKNPNGYIK